MSGPSSIMSEPGSAVVRRRRLGSNELFCNMCHGHHGNLNVMCGLTLLTKQAIDEGLMKCGLQEFQHRYPQLTSRIRPESADSSNLQFIPMECPTFPLDTNFECKDMLHTRFDTENGPLWRVQLVTEETMERASLGFGPEVAAILEDDSPVATRWRYFLRYFQGKVNGQTIANFDEEEEGFRSFLLMTFHPAVTDSLGALHLTKHFLQILDGILEQDGNNTVKPAIDGEEESLHASVESLLPQGEAGMQLGDLFQMAKMATSYVMPRRSPLEDLRPKGTGDQAVDRTEMLRGWLTEEQTAELLAMQEEDDASLHGVILAAGLIAVARVLQSPYGDTRANGNTGGVGGGIPPPDQTANLRATNEANLRQYCAAAGAGSSGHHYRHGSLSTFYETDHAVPPIADRADFWRYAPELTVKHNAAKGSREPLKMLRVYNKMFSLSGGGAAGGGDYLRESSAKIMNEMGVAVYGDMGALFRREHTTSETGWSSSGPASLTRSKSSSVNSNLRLEDVFHMTAAQHLGSPAVHRAHVFRGQLNYILLYHTTYLRQELAFRVRDEVIDILRMATERG